MGRRTVGNFITFLLVLAATVILVGVLSAASRVDPEEAVDRYIRQTQSQEQEPASISAPAKGEPDIPVLASAGAFAALLAIPVVGLMVFAKSSRSGKGTAKGRQSYRPRKDMTLQGSLGAKYH